MSKSDAEPIAIVGMACIFPGARDLATFWSNNVQGVDAISEVPSARWDPLYYDPSVHRPDRFYCRRGGFVDDLAQFDPLGHGVMPVAADGAEPDQLLCLRVGVEALADAGYAERPFVRQRTGVIVARGNYIGSGLGRLEQHVWTAQQLVVSLADLLPGLDRATLDGVKRRFQDELGQVGPDSAIGLVPNLTASRLANRLDLRGPAYTVDAACASSLLALDQAVTELRSGRCDMMLVGGVHLSHNVGIWSIFCQMGALSASQQIRPYDRRADGLLMGEGLGVLVVKRQTDAVRDRDRIYAVVRSVGVGSDGRGQSLVSPSAEGQTLALQRAWEQADCDPEELGYVEGHGTATPTGDEAELETLRRFFGPAPTDAGSADLRQRRVGLGSVKSMIGHAMPAAGMAGLIRTALAIYHGTVPPTLHCEEPHPALERTRFRVPAQAELWPANRSGLRLAAVNAFGFGGINGHAVLQEAQPVSPRAIAVAGALGRTGAAREVSRRMPEGVLALTARTPQELAERLETVDLQHLPEDPGDGPCRLGLLDPTDEALQRARQVVLRGKPWRGRHQIYFSQRGLLAEGGKTAFLFPGIGATFEPRVDDVAAHFGWPLPLCAEKLDPRHAITKVGVGLVGVGRLLDRALRELGIEPDALAGHSLGEWSAMVAAGRVTDGEMEELSSTLQHMAHRDTDAYFVAAGCGVEKVRPLLVDLPDISVSHDNCPHQVMLCGPDASVARLLEKLREAHVLAHKLPFQSGFHSPLFAEFLEPYREVFGRVRLTPARLPLWSCTTVSPYPADEAATRRLLEEHLLTTVRFREVTETLYQEGFRVFIQVGMGSLPGFVADTLTGCDHLCLSANLPQRTGLEQLRHVATALWVEGRTVALHKLACDASIGGAAASRSPEVVSSQPGLGTGGARAITLPLGTSFVRLKTPLPIDGARGTGTAEAAVASGAHGDPLAQRFMASMSDVQRLSHEVLEAFSKRRASVSKRFPVTPAASSPRAAPAAALPRSSEEVSRAARGAPATVGGAGQGETVTLRRPLSVQTCPALLDHSFFWQPEGWPYLSDRRPVAPMTMSLQLLADAAREVAPEKVVVALEDIQAFRWVSADEPLELSVTVARQSQERLTVGIDGHIRAVAVLADSYPAAPRRSSKPLHGERPSPVSAESLYEDRWMFHGPAYQGVRELGPLYDDGIRGVVRVPSGPGGLLDNAGQIFGYWILGTQSDNRLAMPVGAKRIRFYGPDPVRGDELECTVWVLATEARVVFADMELAAGGGHVYACIEGWTDLRLDTDEKLWRVIQHPDRCTMSEPLGASAVVFVDTKRTAPSAQDFLLRRYCAEPERAFYDALEDEQAKRRWLAERVAAKDASRSWLWRSRQRPIFPAEVTVTLGGEVTSTLPGAFHETLRVATARAGDHTVATVSDGSDVAVAAELRDAPSVLARRTMEQLDSSERALLARVTAVLGDATLWQLRAAVAQIAVRCLRGDVEGDCTGEPTSRHRLQEVRGDRVRVGSVWVETRAVDDVVVAWVTGAEASKTGARADGDADAETRGAAA